MFDYIIHITNKLTLVQIKDLKKMIITHKLDLNLKKTHPHTHAHYIYLFVN